MYNEKIITAPVVLFLGAGASRPFGKMLMGEFVDDLKDRNEFKNDRLFWDIVNVPEGRDLEHLFQELDEWSGKDYDLVPRLFDQAELRALGTPPMLAGPSVEETAVRELVRNANQMLENLRQRVFYGYRDFQPDDKKRLVQNFEALLAVLGKKVDLRKNPIVAFTTNYDPAIDTFCEVQAGKYRLCDGFVQGGNAASPVWHRESFDQLELGATSRKDVVLFKLHGSTSWFRRGNDFIKSDALVYARSDPSFGNLLIYPAKRKVALDDPYFTAYDYLQRALENCKFCVVIGYSFRDYDALSRLRSAASYNSKLKLLVLDPLANTLCKDLEKRGVTAHPVSVAFDGYTRDWLTALESELSAPS